MKIIEKCSEKLTRSDCSRSNSFDEQLFIRKHGSVCFLLENEIN